MHIYPAGRIREWDAYTIAHEPVSSLDLMERAASAVLDTLVDTPEYAGKAFYIFCGSGNNGGDGLALARLIAAIQWPVKIFILEAQEYSPDCGANLAKLKELQIPVKEIDGAEEFPVIPGDAIIIDAIFGSGLNRAPDGLSALLIQHINAAAAKTIAVDIPSGLFADKSSLGHKDAIVKADHTFSFQTPKLAFLVAENAPYVTKWQVLNIHLHPEYPALHPAEMEFLELSFIQSLIKKRGKFSHKYDFGSALILAGSPGMYGAGILCAKACTKSGAGLISIAVEEDHIAIYQGVLPEAICLSDWDEAHLLLKKTAIGIGPGWKAKGKYAKLTAALLSQDQIPVVADATAIQWIRENIEQKPPAGTIITPHTGEFDKCFGKSVNDFERINLAIKKAIDLQIYIVLKGAYTLIATPDGKAFFNSTGNPGMAKGGSGDVLTGLLTGLRAQGYSSLHTCLIGVFLHGMAGDLAESEHTSYAMTAMDIVHQFGAAWKKLVISL